MSDHHHQDCACHALGRRRFLKLAAAGAGMAVMPMGRAKAAGDEIVIGGTLAQSGPLQGIVKPFDKLAQAWVDRVNARGGIAMSKLGKTMKLRLVLYDDQSDPASTLKFYERLASIDKVDLFIGPFSSFLTNTALLASETHKLPFFMVEANDSIMFDKPNPWRTTALAPAEWEYKRMADFYAKKGGVKTFALLARDNLHENQAMAGFADWLKKAGFEVVYQEIAPKDIKDFSSIILAMKQKSPDVVFLEALPPPYNIGFFKQARELGLNPKDAIAGHAPVPVLKALGGSAENLLSAVYSFDGETVDHKELTALCAKAGFEPWQYSEAGIRYVTYKRIEDTLRRAGTTDAEAIRKAMWETNYSMYGGELVVQHDKLGYGTLHPWPTQVKKGKHVSLWPLDKGLKMHEFKAGQW